MHTQQMPRHAGDSTLEGQEWFTEVRAAQRAVENAERSRDETVREALAHGLGVRAAARALGWDKNTVSRRFGRKKGES